MAKTDLFGRGALAAIMVAMLGGCGNGFVASDVTLPPRDCRPGVTEAWRPGCATHRNMAAMAADPQDLRRARAEGPRDSMRRDAVIGGYGRKPVLGTETSGATASAGDRGGSQ